MSRVIFCWDMVMEAVSRRKEFASDIKAIEKTMVKNNWAEMDFGLDSCLMWANKTILITDASLQITLASKNMYDMNGYRPGEVIGKYPKMFQGEATCPDTRNMIRKAVSRKEAFKCSIANYRKDGRIYTCKIEGYPIFNKQNALVNFLAVESSQ